MIFYLNSLNIYISVSQRYLESIGIGIHAAMHITSHSYDVHQHLPWLNGLFLTTTSIVAHDAIWNKIIASDIILNIQISICFGLDW